MPGWWSQSWICWTGLRVSYSDRAAMNFSSPRIEQHASQAVGRPEHGKVRQEGVFGLQLRHHIGFQRSAFLRGAAQIGVHPTARSLVLHELLSVKTFGLQIRDVVRRSLQACLRSLHSGERDGREGIHGLWLLKPNATPGAVRRHVNIRRFGLPTVFSK